MSTAKSFLLRASSAVTATFSNFGQLEKDGCNPKVVAAMKQLASHAMIVHAQHEESGGQVTQLTLKGKSDSEVDYSHKVFSVPEMMEIAEFLKKVSAVDGIQAVETYIDEKSLCIEIYGDMG
jgi:hypothetical protein